MNLRREALAGSVGTALLLARVVGSGITAADWFTLSTSFANPAVAIARTLTDTFCGMHPVDAPGFVASLAMGALLAFVLFRGTGKAGDTLVESHSSSRNSGEAAHV